MKVNPIVVDVSHYNDIVDWGKIKAYGIAGVINKVTEGPGLADKTFALRRPHAKANGICFGGYHFLRPGNIVAQASHFLDATAPHDGLLLAVDHEDPKVSIFDLKEFIDQIRLAIGRAPVLYSGFLIKQQLGNVVDPDLAPIKLWLAHYSATPTWPATWIKPWLWQFTDSVLGPFPHRIDGIQGAVDIDSFDGTPAALAQQWAA